MSRLPLHGKNHQTFALGVIMTGAIFSLGFGSLWLFGSKFGAVCSYCGVSVQQFVIVELVYGSLWLLCS